MLPSIEAALAYTFSSDERSVNFKHVDKAYFGVTEDNLTLHDFRVTGQAIGYAPQNLIATDVKARCSTVTDIVAALNPRSTSFFQLAVRDTDDLKRFLYYFLAVEIDVHGVFSQYTRSDHIDSGLIFDSRIRESLAKLLRSRDQNWTNLSDRFVWCVASTWKHLNDSDIAEFKRLKSIRDSIAHGKISSPESADVAAIEKLAKKIHRP